jgi:hypothetical protein
MHILLSNEKMKPEFTCYNLFDNLDVRLNILLAQKKNFGPHFRHCIYMLVIPIKYVYANKIDHHDITEILVKVALNTIKPTYYIIIYSYRLWRLPLKTLIHPLPDPITSKSDGLQIPNKCFSG